MDRIRGDEKLVIRLTIIRRYANFVYIDYDHFQKMKIINSNEKGKERLAKYLVLCGVLVYLLYRRGQPQSLQCDYIDYNFRPFPCNENIGSRDSIIKWSWWSVWFCWFFFTCF